MYCFASTCVCYSLQINIEINIMSTSGLVPAKVQKAHLSLAICDVTVHFKIPYVGPYSQRHTNNDPTRGTILLKRLRELGTCSCLDFAPSLVKVLVRLSFQGGFFFVSLTGCCFFVIFLSSSVWNRGGIDFVLLELQLEDSCWLKKPVASSSDKLFVCLGGQSKGFVAEECQPGLMA